MEENLQKVMNGFDWNKVHMVMNILNWRWSMSDGFKVPNIPEMEGHVRILAYQAVKDFNNATGFKSYVESGGFRVIAMKSPIENEFTFEIEFILENAF